MNHFIPNTDGKIFFPTREPGQYLFDLNDATDNLISSYGLCLPCVIDSEYTQELELCKVKSREIILTQVRPITHKIGRLFLEPQFEGIIPLWLPEDKNIVITTPENEQFPFEGFKVRKKLWSVLDALELCSYKVNMVKGSKEELETLLPFEFVIMGHFLLADYNTGMEGELLNYINSLATKTKGARLIQDRVFKAVTEITNRNGSKFVKDSVNMGYIVEINDYKFAAKLSYKDTCGLIAGEPSYFGVCEALGMSTTEKSLLDNEDKENILETIIKKRGSSIRYFHYDLYSDKMFHKWNEQIREVYKEMRLSPYYKPPALTMGATVRDLRVGALCNTLGIGPEDKESLKELIENFIYPASAEILKKDASTTKALLAKTEGGRCRNNRPLDILLENIVDLDVKSCYADSQRTQIVPIGNGEFIYYPVDSKFNNFMGLDEFVEFYDNGKELPYGGWYARIHTFEELFYDQDFFASWFLDGNSDLSIMAKYISRMKTDTENLERPFNIDDGQLKILNRQIICGVLTADGLDWIMNIASPKQRKDMLSKIKVLSSVVYRKSNQIIQKENENYGQLYERLKKGYYEHTDRNQWETTIGKGNQKKLIYVDGEYHGWIALNEGDLLVDDLVYNRSKHPKKNPDGSKNPANNTFKGCANTNYGNSISPHFKTSNTVQGNNTVARGRSVIWYVEKGLNAVFSITDGGGIDINRVCYPKRKQRITGQNSVNSYRNTHDHNDNIRYAPLNNCTSIKFEWKQFDVVEMKEGELKEKKKWGCSLVIEKESETKKLEAFLLRKENETSEIVEPGRSWVNDKCLEHLRNLFPDVRVLHEETTAIKAIYESMGWVKKHTFRIGMFELEMKDFFDLAIMHGSSNYQFSNPNESVLAMRSYEKKRVDAYKLIDGVIVKTDRYKSKTPPQDFLNQLEKTPEKIIRQEVFVKKGILKIGDYNNRYKYYAALGLKPGDSYLKAGLLREFSLSQFTFTNLKQWNEWDRDYNRLKKNYGQSFEMFFINEDDTLNYQKMIVEIEEMIASGILDPVNVLKKKYGYKKKQLPEKPYHPAFESLVAIKEALSAEEATLEDLLEDLEDLDIDLE